MLRNIIIISTIIFIGNGFSQSSDWSEMKLQGKVRSITEITYKVSGTQNNVIKEFRGEWKVFTFNENGFLTEKIRLVPHDSTVEERIMYSYDKDHKLLSMKAYGNDTLNAQTTHSFIYNTEGLVAKDSIDSHGRNTTYVYTYNQQKQLTELKGYDNDGKYFTMYTYEYDNAGRKKAEKWIVEKDGVVYTDTYEYNSNGKLTKKTTEYTETPGKSYHTYEYNSKNYLVKEVYYGGKGNVLDTYLYTLDLQNNWTEKLTIELKKIFVLVERKIEYF